MRKATNYDKFVVASTLTNSENNGSFPSKQCKENTDKCPKVGLTSSLTILLTTVFCQAKEGFYQWNLVTNYNM